MRTRRRFESITGRHIFTSDKAGGVQCAKQLPKHNRHENNRESAFIGKTLIEPFAFRRTALVRAPNGNVPHLQKLCGASGEELCSVGALPDTARRNTVPRLNKVYLHFDGGEKFVPVLPNELFVL